MPIVRVATNLSRQDLPENFGPMVAIYLSKLFKKEIEKFKWFVDTDKDMGTMRLSKESITIKSSLISLSLLN